MTAGREGTFQTTGSASAKVGCVLEMASSSARLQAQNTEEVERGGERPVMEEQGLFPVL